MSTSGACSAPATCSKNVFTSGYLLGRNCRSRDVQFFREEKLASVELVIGRVFGKSSAKTRPIGHLVNFKTGGQFHSYLFVVTLGVERHRRSSRVRLDDNSVPALDDRRPKHQQPLLDDLRINWSFEGDVEPKLLFVESVFCFKPELD